MTEHVVLRRATDALADLQHRRELALIALDALDEEIREVDLFIEMYHRFSGEEPLSNGSGEVQDECAIHLPNNSNNVPAEDARLEDGSGPSKEGDTTSAATDGIAGTSVSSTDPDGGGSNSPETANQSAGSAVAAVTGENAQLADAVGVEPLPADTNPEQEIGGAEGDVRPVLASSDTSGIPTPALDHPTVKPVGERDGSPAAPVTKKERVAQTHDEHPDWTIAKIAAHLNLTTDAASRHLQALGIKLGHKGSPRKKAPGEPTVREKVLAAHAAHPDWPQKQIADALGIGTGSVSNAVKGLGIEFPKSPNSLPKPDSQRARVEAFLLDHPDATVRDTATALGLAFSRVRAIAAEAGIQFRKLTPAELQAARRAGALKSAAVRRRGAGVPIAGKPEPASEPQHQPFTVGDQDEEPVHPTVAKFSSPNAKWFRLRRSDGMWLHMSGHGFTVEKKDGWIGKIGQLRAIRGNPRYPDARGLQIIGVTQVAK
jgi:hypothetical protein